jgi:hypothetical protein
MVEIIVPPPFEPSIMAATVNGTSSNTPAQAASFVPEVVL